MHIDRIVIAWIALRGRNIQRGRVFPGKSPRLRYYRIHPSWCMLLRAGGHTRADTHTHYADVGEACRGRRRKGENVG